MGGAAVRRPHLLHRRRTSPTGQLRSRARQPTTADRRRGLAHLSRSTSTTAFEVGGRLHPRERRLPELRARSADGNVRAGGGAARGQVPESSQAALVGDSAVFDPTGPVSRPPLAAGRDPTPPTSRRTSRRSAAASPARRSPRGLDFRQYIRSRSAATWRCACSAAASRRQRPAAVLLRRPRHPARLRLPRLRRRSRGFYANLEYRFPLIDASARPGPRLPGHPRPRLPRRRRRLVHLRPGLRVLGQREQPAGGRPSRPTATA